MAFYQHFRTPTLMLATMFTLLPGGVLAQQRPMPTPLAQQPTIPPPIAVPAGALSTTPMPAAAEINRMIWSTMATVDGAISSGNYSVLRDTAAPGFQTVNDTAKLAGIFARLRASGVDLSQTMLLTPSFRTAPQLVQPGLLRVQGSFGMRPTALDFEMLYQWTGGKWRMFGVAISTARLPVQQGAAVQQSPAVQQGAAPALSPAPGASPPPGRR